jgi:hypothetical protein
LSWPWPVRFGARLLVLVGNLRRAYLPMISGVKGIAAPEVVGEASSGAIIGGLAGRERLAGRRR